MIKVFDDTDKLLPGVSGIMRVKNDALFIEPSVKSCINALDELIIVWNDCSDNSAEVIERMRSRYPDKIKAYEYKHKVYSVKLTKEEYEYVKALPEDSPFLLCNYYNFALSKVTRKYAMKIDADQVYYPQKLAYWCDVYRGIPRNKSIKVILGYFVWVYMKVINRINLTEDRAPYLLPKFKTQFIWRFYESFVAYKASHGSPVSLSGVDVVRFGEWGVTLGKRTSIINILPPYNGVGDHLVFKVTPNVYYRPDDCKFYNELRSENYSYIEWFEHDGGRDYPVGPCWFHINAMRESVYKKICKALELNPSSILPITRFCQSDFNKDLKPQMDKGMFTQQQNNLFQFIHQLNTQDIIENIAVLNTISI